MLNRTLLPLVIAAAVAGCYGEVTTPAGATQVTAAPVDATATDLPPDADIDVAPQVMYEGRPTYFYHDRWYYRDGSNWSYYRQEPGALRAHRSQLQNNHPSASRPVARPVAHPAAHPVEHSTEHEEHR
jgi:hypothetical protein